MTGSEIGFLEREFNRCWPWLAAAVERYGPTHRREHVWAEIESGRAQLWPSPHAAMVTVVKEHPTGFSEVLGWLAGGDLSEIKPLIPTIEKWAKQAGCHRAVIMGRKGWSRAFDGYEPSLAVMVKEI